jgi:hypothetical protein
MDFEEKVLKLSLLPKKLYFAQDYKRNSMRHYSINSRNTTVNYIAFFFREKTNKSQSGKLSWILNEYEKMFPPAERLAITLNEEYLPYSFRKLFYHTIQAVTYFHVMQGSTGARFMPSTSVSPLSIIPTMRHMHLLI